MSYLSHGVLSLFKAPKCFGPEKLAERRSTLMSTEYGGQEGRKPMKRDSNGEQCDPSQKASLHGDPAVFSGLDLRVPCWNQGPAVIKWRHCWGGGGHWALETWLSSPPHPARGRASFVWLFCCNFYTTLGASLRTRELLRWERKRENKRRRLLEVMHRSASTRGEGMHPVRRRRRPIARGPVFAAMT